MTSKIIVNNIGSDTGINTVTFDSNLQRGTSNLHSTGLNVSDTFLHSTGLNVGTGATIHQPADNVMTLGTNGSERLRITSTGVVGITTGLTVGPLTGTTGVGATITHQGHAQFAGVCTATSFVGNGANLTGINTPTLAGGTMTLGFQDHVAGAVSSTTPTGYYQRIGNMVFCSADTGAINLSGLNNGQILLVTGCFPVTRDNNWTMAGSAYQYTVNSGQNSGGPVIVPTMGYWLSNTSLYFVIPRNNSTADNMTVGMCNSNNTRIFMQWSYKVA